MLTKPELVDIVTVVAQTKVFAILEAAQGSRLKVKGNVPLK
jgi:hypothetical protein